VQGDQFIEEAVALFLRGADPVEPGVDAREQAWVAS
jgi:hypothetical protein